MNVSSPNTPGLRALQEKDALTKIFAELQHINAGKAKPKPILLKIAPDLNQAQLDDIIDLSLSMKLSGLVATNTTLDRSKLSPSSAQLSEAIGMGGLKYFLLKVDPKKHSCKNLQRLYSTFTNKPMVKYPLLPAVASLMVKTPTASLKRVHH